MGILNKACCCCQLATAAVLLGWLGAIGYFMVITSLIIDVSTRNFFEVNELTDVIQIAVVCSGFLVSLVNLIGCGCLMVGSIKKIRHLIVPWLIGEIIFITFLLFCFGAFLLEYILFQRSYLFQQLVMSLFYLLFQIYAWVCVYSLFQELREHDNQKLGVSTTKTITLKDDAQPYSSFA